MQVYILIQQKEFLDDFFIKTRTPEWIKEIKVYLEALVSWSVDRNNMKNKC